ncbi:hypothetical protein AB832_07565 [Flavobacteriaceae bacterium (ex Bugula neritina AB1)]|nr:hypothetical protein AB832_07565 [Flavobacteriaceae bacterium (ex Bugula neritina AB1)]
MNMKRFEKIIPWLFLIIDFLIGICVLLMIPTILIMTSLASFFNNMSLMVVSNIFTVSAATLIGIIVYFVYK